MWVCCLVGWEGGSGQHTLPSAKGQLRVFGCPVSSGTQISLTDLCRVLREMESGSSVLRCGLCNQLFSFPAGFENCAITCWVRGGFTGDVLVMSRRQLRSSFPCSSFSPGGVPLPLSYPVSWARKAHSHCEQLR